ncbi:MAG TPA: chemotaxis protein CheW [Kofleriaceae bacterium]|nr:chemotaxis protein CheW [Kofleriaceae bacterium]
MTVELVVWIAGRACALPIAHVIETLRPPPIQPWPDAPPAVLGVARIRGVSVPVVDGATLLGAPAGGPPARLVTLRIGARQVALAVERVDGVRRLDAAARTALPPLLRDDDGPIAAIAARDAELVLVLRSGRLVPAEASP